MKNVEQELKLSLDEREYNILSAQTASMPQLQTNYYFASDSMPADTMVRIRQKGQQYLLSFKRRISHNNNVSVCDERECEISPEFADSMLSRGITAHELGELLNFHTSDSLYYVGSMDTYRTKFRLESWTVELDKNVYLGLTDYELECEDADVSSLDKLKNYIFYTYGVVARPSSAKVERFRQAQQQIVNGQ